jgi:putative spermidine/putrescine transport system permease protein
MAQADATALDPGIESTRPERLRTADGVPLKAALRRAERRRKIAAFLLVAPLLFFILTFFVFPIAQMMWRSVDNPQVVRALPLTLEALDGWDGEGIPGEAVFAALHADFMADEQRPRRDQAMGPLAVRLNYELSAARSAITRTSRGVEDMTPPYREAFLDAHRLWADPELWRVIEREGRPLTSSYYVAALDREFDAEGNIVRATRTGASTCRFSSAPSCCRPRSPS